MARGEELHRGQAAPRLTLALPLTLALNPNPNPGPDANSSPSPSPDRTQVELLGLLQDNFDWQDQLGLDWQLGLGLRRVVPEPVRLAGPV